MIFNNFKKRTEAKLIFFKYNGSKFQMERESQLEKYQKYCISKKTEDKWMSELVQNKFIELDKTTEVKLGLNLLSQIEQLSVTSSDTSIASQLCALLKTKLGKLDSFTKLRGAETILSILERGNTFKSNKDVVDSLKKIVREIKDNPGKISKDNFEDGSIPEYMNELNIIKRANRVLEKIESDLV